MRYAHATSGVDKIKAAVCGHVMLNPCPIKPRAESLIGRDKRKKKTYKEIGVSVPLPQRHTFRTLLGIGALFGEYDAIGLPGRRPSIDRGGGVKQYVRTRLSVPDLSF